MKATKITVSAGRTFNHPYEQYSNFRSHVEVEYELSAGEDEFAAAKTAQARVEGMAEDHKQNLLKSVEELENMRQTQKEVLGLQRQLAETQKRLDEIRAQHPVSAALADETKSSADDVAF